MDSSTLAINHMHINQDHMHCYLEKSSPFHINSRRYDGPTTDFVRKRREPLPNAIIVAQQHYTVNTSGIYSFLPRNKIYILPFSIVSCAHARNPQEPTISSYTIAIAQHLAIHDVQD